MAMGNITLNKIFIESRYPKNLLFNDMSKLTSIQRNTMELFSTYDYNKNINALNLSNPEKHITSVVEDSRCTFDIDEPISAEFFKNNSIKFMEMINNILEINQINRVGIRAYWGLEFETLQAANDTIRQIFFKPLNKADIFYGENINNCRIMFTSSIADFKTNIAISPNNIQLVEIANGKTVRQCNRMEITYDIDLYKEGNINASLLKSTIRHAVEISAEQAKTFEGIVIGD